MDTVTFDDLPKLPPRPADSHKGDYGRVLVVGGSRGMSGAVSLAAKAALRGGAGLVRAAVPEGILPIVAAYEPSYLTAGLPEDSEGRICAAARPVLAELAAANDVLALGPGLGRSAELDDLVAWLYRDYELPMVVDADGLNALAEQRDRLARAGAARILTPHPGEFSRLTEFTTAAVQSNRLALAVEFAERHGVVLVLKGRATIVTDGDRQFTNPTGNPGMATGGTGDVLTGLIAALLAQKLPPFEAASLGVYLHGLAGDLAAEELGEAALIASDLMHYLPRAISAAGASKRS
jgi:NAD(P)H-hydrate epimerase